MFENTKKCPRVCKRKGNKNECTTYKRTTVLCVVFVEIKLSAVGG